MAALRYLSTLAFLLPGALADRQYVTRPDLSPPRLNITIPADKGVGDGYIFVGPYSGFKKGDGLDGPEQPAGYIYRDNGDLIWSSMGYLSGWVGNMQVRTWKGKEVISAFQGTLDSFHGHGFGHPTILDANYENIRDLRGGNHKIISIHEFNILPSGSALIEVYQPADTDLSAYSDDPKSRWIVDAIFQGVYFTAIDIDYQDYNDADWKSPKEIDIETGDLLFEWSSLEHCSPAHSNVSLPSGHAGDGYNSTSAWDYFHINSVDKDADGNYLISARHASALYKVHGRTGEVMWQLGGHNSTFRLDEGVLFGFQHDARFVKTSSTTKDVEYVSVFDNAARANGHRGGGVEVVHSKSRAKVIRLDKATGVASLEWSLSSPDDLLAPSQGNVQTLPNGNLFVNWGQAGAVTEYSASNGKVLFHAHLDSGEIGEGVQSYRGFRFPWKGYPREAPAIVSLAKTGGKRTVYVSWNGDTETRKWRFFTTTASCAANSTWFCRPRLLGEVERSAFETSFDIVGDDVEDGFIFAEAIDAEGQSLVKSALIAWGGSSPASLLEPEDGSEQVLAPLAEHRGQFELI